MEIPRIKKEIISKSVIVKVIALVRVDLLLRDGRGGGGGSPELGTAEGGTCTCFKQLCLLLLRGYG